MNTDTFARIAAAAHRSVPSAIAQPALEQAITTLHAMHPIDAATGRALVRSVLDAGQPALVAEAWRVLPQTLLVERTLPTSFITESPTDGVSASLWNGDAPNTDAVRLWIWANGLDGTNAFSLLKRTQGGDAQTAMTASLRMAIALASLDDLDWSVPESPHSVAGAILDWRLSGLPAAMVAELGPLDARLATLPAATWVRAWKGEHNAFALPLLKSVALTPELVAGMAGVRLGHVRRHGIANTMPTTTHGVLALLHALPDAAAFEAMDMDERAAAVRAVMGDDIRIKKLSWAHRTDSPEAIAKRDARAMKKARREADQHGPTNA